MGKIAVVLSVFLLAQACTSSSQRETPAPEVQGSQVTPLRPVERKLIEFGFDLPSADFVAAHIDEMERRPFDGIVFRPGPADLRRRAFDVRAWSTEDLHLDTLQEIEWGRFTDNFLHLYSASFSTMDWFDDGHWRTITANMRLYRQAVDACRCVGIAFDPEYYGGRNPWAYTTSDSRGRSFEAVQDQVRSRGAEFAEALQEPGGELTLLFFFLLGYVRGDLARGTELTDSRYALLPAFLDGILDSAEPGLTVVDGNEDAYYYQDTNDFYDAASWIRGSAELVAPENRDAYRAHVQVGSSLFVDPILAEQPAEYGQALWTHNVYTALATSERYVWCYSQAQDWWRGEIIPGSARGIRRARARIQSLQPLGYDLADASGPNTLLEFPAVQLAMTTSGRDLVARVTGTDVVRVEFYRSGELVASDSQAPYRLDITPETTVGVTFVARAFDAEGRHGTSAPVQVSA